MKIIVGLGNPGKSYARTRHNAGFMAIDELAKSLHIEINREKHGALFAKTRIGPTEAVLVKPQTYMNESGLAVQAVLRDAYAGLEDLIVLHDELDLPLGAVRVKIGGGHGGHNGLRSIIEHTGSADFLRVRIGIGRPTAAMDAADYVLRQFAPEEREAASASTARAADAAMCTVKEGPVRAMNLFNQK